MMRMLPWSQALTSLSRLESMNWALSMKRSCPRLKEMFIYVLLGMQGIFPAFSGIACMMR